VTLREERERKSTGFFLILVDTIPQSTAFQHVYADRWFACAVFANFCVQLSSPGRRDGWEFGEGSGALSCGLGAREFRSLVWFRRSVRSKLAQTWKSLSLHAKEAWIRAPLGVRRRPTKRAIFGLNSVPVLVSETGDRCEVRWRSRIRWPEPRRTAYLNSAPDRELIWRMGGFRKLTVRARCADPKSNKNDNMYCSSLMKGIWRVVLTRDFRVFAISCNFACPTSPSCRGLHSHWFLTGAISPTRSRQGAHRSLVVPYQKDDCFVSALGNNTEEVPILPSEKKKTRVHRASLECPPPQGRSLCSGV